MHWYKLELSCYKKEAVEIEERLLGFDALSICLTSQGMCEEFYEMMYPNIPLWEFVNVSAVFEKKILSADINQILKKNKYSNLVISTFKDRDWVKSYQKDFTPMQFGKKLWILPSWGERKFNSEDVIVKMDPGMAFGSGTHETTSLCLEYLEGHHPKNYHVIDYGCGSGILGIAAILLGAKSALAIDNDYQSIKTTNENAILNSVDHKLLTQDGNEKIDIKADLLIANIFSEVLLKLRQKFIDIVKPNGKVVLSGILDNQVKKILNAYKKDFIFVNHYKKNEWFLLEFRKK